MATDQKVGGSNPLMHVKKVGRFPADFFYVHYFPKRKSDARGASLFFERGTKVVLIIITVEAGD